MKPNKGKLQTILIVAIVLALILCGIVTTLTTGINPIQVYGSMINSSSVYDVGEGCKQLPLFKFINPSYFGRNYYWLRDVAGPSSFALIGYYGVPDMNAASKKFAVRPLITIG